MRAGLFGGTFNPIHNGHLMVVEQVLGQFALNRLYIIPCRVPPHKSPTYLAPAADRLQMIRLALPADDRICPSDVEIRRSGPSYTIDTVTHFASVVVPGSDLFLVMGLDAFFEIHTWKGFRPLLQRVQPVAVTRPLEGGGGTPLNLDQMNAYIRSHLPGAYEADAQQACWRNAAGNAIHLLPVNPMTVSSSQVRRRTMAGRSIADLVPAPVKAYIEEKELYR
jgi:nicotinate-nucleotide adenylyltransferase